MFVLAHVSSILIINARLLLTQPKFSLYILYMDLVFLLITSTKTLCFGVCWFSKQPFLSETNKCSTIEFLSKKIPFFRDDIVHRIIFICC